MSRALSLEAWSALSAQETSEVFLVLLTLAHGATGYPSVILADLPVGYWHLSEASGIYAGEASGHGYAGVYLGSPSLGVPGLISSDAAVQLDGVNDYVDIVGTAAALGVNGRATMSVECWVQTTATPAAGHLQFFVCKPKSAFYAYAIYLDGNVPGKAVVAFGLATSSVLLFASVKTINDGLPHHLVAVRDALGAYLYVDGVLDTFLADTHTIEDNQILGFRIGALGVEFGGIESYAQTIIDEVAIYFTALSPSRVAAHYAARTAEELTLRFVNNTQPIVSRGHTFLPYAFDILLPQEREDQVPQVQIQIDNVDRVIVQGLRSLTTRPTITMEIVLASAPDTVEVGPFDFELKSAVYNALTIQGELGFEPILQEPFPFADFTPNLFPGLF